MGTYTLQDFKAVYNENCWYTLMNIVQFSVYFFIPTLYADVASKFDNYILHPTSYITYIS